MSIPMSRRRALRLGGAAAAVPLLGAAGWELLHGTGRSGSGLPGGPSRQLERADLVTSGSAYLHVIAHADDGLYFHNPDLLQAITSGAPAVTVCMTGGESDGVNGPVVKGHGPPRNRPNFTRARMNGLRAAHARMATGDELSPWQIESVELVPGFQVELNTLRDAPAVQLIWMELQEARTVSIPNPVSLKGLWLGATTRLPTIRPTGSPVPKRYVYGRDDVVATLTAVLKQYRPTVVRTLDPNPVHQFRQPADFGALHGRPPAPLLRLPVYQDHQDHTYSAYFAQQALQDYYGSGTGSSQVRDCTVESYLGYVNGSLPWNLDPAARARKQASLDVYNWSDHRDCGDPAGCGDRKVSRAAAHGSWSVSTRYRAPGSGEWLQPLPDGRLVAFGLLAGTAKFWLERGAGSGDWSGPHTIPGQGLEGQLSALRLHDGRLLVLGVRNHLADSAAGHRRELVACVQAPGPAGAQLAFGDWQTLGTPENDALASMEMGYPVAVPTAAGGVQVFVRDRSGSVSTRVQDAAGGWGGWSVLPKQAGTDPGIGVQDGLGAARTSDGRVHLLAAGKSSVEHWTSAAPGGPLRPAAPTGLPVPGGPVTAVARPDGSLSLYYREARTAQILVATLPAKGGGWTVSGQIKGPGGFGRVLAAALPAAHGGSTAAGTRTIMAARDDQGRVALAVDRGALTVWTQQGGFHAGSAGLALDASGRAVVAAIGADGLLRTVRQADGSTRTLFPAWQQAAPTGTPA